MYVMYVCMYIRWDRINKGIAAPFCGAGQVRGGSNALVFAGVEERFQKLIVNHSFIFMYIRMYVCMYGG